MPDNSSIKYIFAIVLSSTYTLLSGQEIGYTALYEPADGVKYDLNETFYRIQGTTAEELANSMKENMPEYNGYYAMVDWDVHWSYGYTNEDKKCLLKNISVKTKVSVIMPAWDKESPSEDLEESWNEFMLALENHENGHINNSILAANEICMALNTFSKSKCDNVQTEANSMVEGIMQKYRSDDAYYDHTTSHGAEQGAVWPPR